MAISFRASQQTPVELNALPPSHDMRDFSRHIVTKMGMQGTKGVAPATPRHKFGNVFYGRASPAHPELVEG